MFQEDILIDFENPVRARLASSELQVDSDGNGELILTYKADLEDVLVEDLAYLELFISQAMERVARDKNAQLNRTLFAEIDEDMPYHKPQFADDDDFELLYGSDDF